MEEADFVIIGSGSAGSALAARLSDDGRTRVVVIEHGGTDFGPFIQMPAALSYPMRMARYDWGFLSEPEPHLAGRRLACPRGKVLGGSSSINGMVFVRGHAGDFDHWEEAGARGWSHADVLPYFRRLETSHGGEDGWRGRDGPVHVTRGSSGNPLFEAFLAAGAQAGYPRTADTNGAQQEGFGPLERTVWRGRRWSAANAYLRPALKRANVRLVRAFARRIVLEARRAVGVEIARGGRIEVQRAARAVVIAASPINSPKLLLLSGIGPADELARHAIPVVADRPGVGRNLQDHLEVYIQYASRSAHSLNGKLGLLSKARIGLQWLTTGSGDGASNHFEAGAFLRSGDDVDYPDIQLHFLPAAVRYDGSAAHPGHGFQIHAGPMRSRARGSVALRSGDPDAAPVIRFNYMSDPRDWVEFRRAIRLVRRVVAQPAFDAHRDREIAPGPGVESDADIDAFVRSHAESAYHPCGTCRMGRVDDPHAVVGPDCRVIGIDNLAVADTSIFPRITNGNLNAPAMMVGEKAADHLLGRTPLARSNLAPVAARPGAGTFERRGT